MELSPSVRRIRRVKAPVGADTTSSLTMSVEPGSTMPTTSTSGEPKRAPLAGDWMLIQGAVRSTRTVRTTVWVLPAVSVATMLTWLTSTLRGTLAVKLPNASTVAGTPFTSTVTPVRSVWPETVSVVVITSASTSGEMTARYGGCRSTKAKSDALPWLLSASIATTVIVFGPSKTGRSMMKYECTPSGRVSTSGGARPFTKIWAPTSVSADRVIEALLVMMLDEAGDKMRTTGAVRSTSTGMTRVM